MSLGGLSGTENVQLEYTGGKEDAKNRTVKGLKKVGDELVTGDKESSVEENTMEQELGSQGRRNIS